MGELLVAAGLTVWAAAASLLVAISHPTAGMVTAILGGVLCLTLLGVDQLIKLAEHSRMWAGVTGGLLVVAALIAYFGIHQQKYEKCMVKPATLIWPTHCG